MQPTLYLPHLAPGATVLCLQNGVDNAERLRSVLPHHTVAAAVVYVVTEMAGPGQVKHQGRGDLVIEPSAAHVAPALAAAGIAAEVSDNVCQPRPRASRWPAMWTPRCA